MDLKSFFERNPVLRPFDSVQDQTLVLDFFSQAPMKVAGIELLYDRSPDFSRLLKCQGFDAITILGESERRLRLVCSISLERKWVQGQMATVGYLSDFRTDRSRQSARIWRNHYGNVLQAIREACAPVDHYLTAVLAGNQEAVRNFARPRNDFGMRYDPLIEMDMVNVYSPFPWRKLALPRTERASSADFAALKTFIEEAEKKKDFGTVFNSDLWARRQKDWPGFELGNFLIQKDATGSIKACTLPWNPGFAKRMKVVRAPRSLQMGFRILSGVGFSMPQVGESLETVYLTHLNQDPDWDPLESTESFLQYLFKREPRSHLVSFADSSGFSKKMKGWIGQRVPVLLFTVAGSSEPAFQRTDRAVGFEMGLV